MAASQKTVTRQTLIGEAGINLIGQRALEMGYLFHPRRVDHGIDGHLDLVDSRTGALLNLVLLVQSKAQDAPFANETPDGFHYLCKPADLDLWLAGNAPVVLIFSHPKTGDAWWVDVKAAFPTPQSRATRRVDVDKRTQRFDRDADALLLDVGKPRALGLYLRPAPKPETIESNLVPVEALPPKIYLARSAAVDYRGAGALLGASRTRDVWVLRDGNVLSFHDLRGSDLAVLASSDVEEHDTAEWARTQDQDALWTFTDLLSRTILGSHPELRWHNRRKHAHFQRSRDLQPRKIPSGSANRKRTVFKPQGDDGTGGVGFYSHAALKLRPRRIAGRWYVQLEPDYCFTSDGVDEHRNADRLLAGIKRLEKHTAVKGWVRMWALFLRGPDDLFAPALPVELGELLTFDVQDGIDDRLWGPMPEDAGPSVDDDHEPAAAVLPLEEYEADLLSLLDEEPVEEPATPESDPAIVVAAAKPTRPRRPRRATREAGHAR
jgi:Domain of unknown function (DUF4365)